MVNLSFALRVNWDLLPVLFLQERLRGAKCTGCWMSFVGAHVRGQEYINKECATPISPGSETLPIYLDIKRF